jgi:diguanylate cyclase (GGDEF)-like protein/PAS domain S-box-containing protein
MAASLRFPAQWDSLSNKLIAGVCATLIIFGIMLLASSVEDNADFKRVALSNHLQDELSFLAPTLAEQAVLGDYTNIRTILGTQAKRKDTAKITWISTSKKVISIEDDDISLEAPQWFVTWVNIPPQTRSRDITVGGVTYGRLVLKGSPKTAINTTWAGFINELQILLIAIGACIAVMVSIINRGLRPLKTLAASARKFGQGDYSVRIPQTGTAEIQDSIRSFNSMADNIDGLLRSLQSSETKNQLLATIVEQSSEAIVTIDIGGQITSWNSGAAQLFGYSADEAVGQPYQLLSSDTGAALGGLGRQLEDSDASRFELTMRSRSGQQLDVEISITPLFNENSGVRIGEIIVARDISERKRFQDTLFEEKERAQVTLKSIGDAVITTDMFGNIEYLNPVAEQLTGWAAEQARNLPVSRVYKLMDEATGQIIENAVHTALRGEVRQEKNQFATLLSRDNQRFPIQGSYAPIYNSQGGVIGAVIVFHDVSQNRKMVHQLSWQAQHDNLTGLVNRHEFENRLRFLVEKTASDRQQSVLMYMDLDQFKVVNDTCGHVAGDELLRQISALLKSRVRGTDTLARLGGDEFGVLLDNCPIEKGRAIAETLRQTVSDFRFAWEGKTFTLGVSIGLVELDETTLSINNILSAADSACYSAKDKGRNRIQVYRQDDSEIARRQGEMQWVTRITRAFEEDRYRLYYQPISPLQEHAESGDHYELLIRMVDEEGQLVPPMAFIPAAERYNLMPRLDRWVIRKAFSEFEKIYRADSGRKLHTATINISGASLNDEMFGSYVKEQLARFNIAPPTICFEITETIAIANLTQAGRFIQELKTLGCRFSLDDFGSGMSSFGYLKNLPVDYLKIDGSFIKDMLNDPIDNAMARSINQIGHVMGLRTIAEFVENDAILAEVKAIGVDYAQGYGIARPRPFDDLQESRVFVATDLLAATEKGEDSRQSRV